MAASPVTTSTKTGPSFFLSWGPKPHSDLLAIGATTPESPLSPCSPENPPAISRRPHPVSSQSESSLEVKIKPLLQSSDRVQKASKDSRRSHTRSSSSFNSNRYHPGRIPSDSNQPPFSSLSSQNNASHIVEEFQQQDPRPKALFHSNPSHTRFPSSSSQHEDDSYSHELHVQGPTTKDGRPSRDARSGFVWKLKPAGYWFEEKLKKHTRGSASPTSISIATVSPASSAAATPHQSETAAGKIRSHEVLPNHGRTPSGSHSSNAGSSSQSLQNKATDRKESFLGKSKRRLRALHHSTSPPHKVEDSDTWSIASKTKVLLDMVNNVIHAAEKDQRRSPDSTLSASGASVSDRSSKMLNALNKHGKTKSASSSIRKVLMGKPPVNTPMPDALYGGTDATDYFKVEISDPDNPTFLPSEARRVNTPPLPSEGPRKGQLRGFFFDLNSPGGTARTPDDTFYSQSSKLGPSSAARRRTRSNSLEGVDWFRIDEDSDDSDRPFELDVPEHLPSSPLCPQNPLHKSGGKGICVYHGRIRT